jgi:uncharacterized RDD family membrane protein YckC
MRADPPNPFLTPRAPEEPPARAGGRDEALLAPPGVRLSGAMIDGLAFLAVCVPAIVGLVVEAGSLDSDPGATLLGGGAVSVLGVLALFVYQSWRIANHGQSIGKAVVGTRIEGPDGGPPGWLHGVVLRTLVPAVIGSVPLLGGLFQLVDGAMVFSEDRRTLHDRIASTRVVFAEGAGRR